MSWTMKCTWLALLLVGCDSDEGIGDINKAPTVEISYDQDAGPLREGLALALKALVSDEDDIYRDLDVEWYRNGARVCETTRIDDNGVTECQQTLAYGTEQFEVRVSDGRELSDDYLTLQVNPNHPPTAQLISPDTVDALYADAPIHFEGMVSDLDDPYTVLSVRWHSNKDGDLVEMQNQPNASGEVSDTGFLSPGEHLISMAVTDPLGKTHQTSRYVDVAAQNTPPSCRITAPAPDSASNPTLTLKLEGFAHDVDVDANRLTATWSSDVDGVLGTTNPGGDGHIVLHRNGMSTGPHRLTLTVEDERGDTCVENIMHTVGEAPEVMILEPTGGTVINEGEPVTFMANVRDEMFGPENVDLLWESNLVGRISTQSANTAGLAQFSESELSYGTHLITVTATNEIDMSSEDTVSLTINALPTKPTTLTIDPLEPKANEPLTATASGSTDADGVVPDYKYTWMKVGSTSVYTGATLTEGTTKGEEWQVTATPYDRYGDGPSITASVIIQNTPPTLSGATLSPTAPKAKETLTCAGVGYADADGDPNQTTYEWTAGGVALGTASTLTLPSGYGDGDTITCTVTAYDGEDEGTIISRSVTLVNTPPTAPGLQMIPNRPIEGVDDILCDILLPSTDADEDAITYTFEWQRNGTSFTGTKGTTTYAGDTILARDTVADDKWTCTVTADDGKDDGPSAAQTVTVHSIYGTATHPAGTSCDDVLTSNPSAPDGIYWLGTSTWVDEYECDMTTAGGGWTNVGAWGAASSPKTYKKADLPGLSDYASTPINSVSSSGMSYYAGSSFAYWSTSSSGSIRTEVEVLVPNSGEYLFDAKVRHIRWNTYRYYGGYPYYYYGYHYDSDVGIWFSVDAGGSSLENVWCRANRISGPTSSCPTVTSNDVTYRPSIQATASGQIESFEMEARQQRNHYYYSSSYAAWTYLYDVELWVR